MHIGEKIKSRAKELRIGPTELARKIRTSKQNIYGIYNRASIDTELLAKLSKALEFDFFVYYSKGGSIEWNADFPKYGKRKGGASAELDVNTLKRELSELQTKYELLRALYEAKVGKKAPGN